MKNSRKLEKLHMGFITMPNKSAREMALQILYRIETKKAYSTVLLDQAANDQNWDGNQALLRQLVKGTLEWRGKIDSVLEQVVKGDLDSLTPWIRNILRLATYQILFLDRIPPEVAVNESVELAKRYGHRGTVRLVNAVLRKVVAQRQQKVAPPIVEQDPADYIAINFSHPKWMVQRWIQQLGAEETIELCMANNQAGHLCLRTNTLKGSTSDLRMQLEKEGIDFRPAQYAPDCTIVTKLPRTTRLNQLSSYCNGLFQVQDESSALIAYLVDPQPGECIVDLCSAPGGKTTHCAALMQNQGRILAVDLHRHRLHLIQTNAKRLGITMIEEVCADGRTLHLDHLADRVLVDAPCSGLGVLGRRSDARWNKAESDLQGLRVLQLELLQHASTLVKPGGRLVYSTCTIDIDENEGIVQTFINNSSDYKLLGAPEHIPTPLVDQQGYYRTWPHRHDMGGAFGAVMIRSV
ncbi:MAG: 16S rRNA (cytosine(967)-C(5))-methyltransferase RsmB [Chloroflexota bacterium]|nr:16S rRNA (cytosine(967)-C(5))-methyltransferase RsmB [Chloroflexota bacterium]